MKTSNSPHAPNLLLILLLAPMTSLSWTTVPDNTSSELIQLFRFSGHSSQFAQFATWMTSSVYDLALCNLTFDLRTTCDDCWLLYFDDGGSTNYLKLSLASGLAKFDYKFTGGVSQTTLIRTAPLSDGNWHHVEILRRAGVVIFSIDGTQTRAQMGSGSGLFIQSSKTYFGGIPDNISVQELSSVGVYLIKNRFRGSLRRIAMNGEEMKMEKSDHVMFGELHEACAPSRSPCKNNGKCNVVDFVATCDCSETHFMGPYCQLASPSGLNSGLMMADEAAGEAVATFHGSEWFSYILPPRGVTSLHNEIKLSFKTRQSNGLILHTGRSRDYLNFFLRGGKLLLAVNLGAGETTLTLETTDEPFNNNKWHNVTITREQKEIKMTVDNATAVATGNVEDSNIELTLTDQIFVGGTVDNLGMPGSIVSSNFAGCLKEVTYATGANKRTLEVIELSRLAMNGHKDVIIEGGIEFSCNANSGISGPITFLTPTSFIEIESWSNDQRGSIEFRFKTSEDDGLLLYGSGHDNKDYIALELYNKVLHCSIDLGSGKTQVSMPNDLLLTGRSWHHLIFNRNGRSITLTVDGRTRNITMEGDNTELNSMKKLLLGGTRAGTSFKKIGLKSRVGFLGCMSDVKKDSVNVDVQTVAENSFSSNPSNPNVINTGCKEAMTNECEKSPCENKGLCRSKMYGFTCDCSSTSYKGKICEIAVQRSGYDGTQFMSFSSTEQQQSEGEDISMRFKTKYCQGLLFSTTSNSSSDKLQISITTDGSIMLTIDIDDPSADPPSYPREGIQSLVAGSGLADGNWHVVRVHRRSRKLILEVDGDIVALDLRKGHTSLAYDQLHIGKIISPKNSVDGLFGPLIGLVENFVLDGKYLMDSCFYGEVSCSYNSSWLQEKEVVAYPVSFVESKSFVKIAALGAGGSLSISFSLRTIVSDGIILFNRGSTNDYIAVELMNGKLFFFVAANGKTESLTVDVAINNNRWHQVKIQRLPSNCYRLWINNNTKAMEFPALVTPYLNESLYIGGVDNDMYSSKLPKNLYSRNGYEGCFGSFVVNNKLINLMSNRVYRRPVDGTILQGCQGPYQAKCKCINGGECQRRWRGYRCDCSTTVYAGETCSEHGPGCLFGANTSTSGGVVIYHWSKYPSTRTDTLNLMFQTTSKDAALVFVKGKEPLGDFFKLTIENGKLTLTYNVGVKEIRLQEEISVADGNLHNVAIKRHYTNATMQVNDWPPRKSKERGSNSLAALVMAAIPSVTQPVVKSWLNNKDSINTVFNTQSSIEIGGILSPKYKPSNSNTTSYTIDMPFRGKMSRVFYNDVKPFELLNSNDESVKTFGDVQTVGFPEPATTVSPFVSSPLPTSDDLNLLETTLGDTTCKAGRCNNDGIVNGTGNIPITLAPIKRAMIAGVASAATLAVAGLIACIYCYKSKNGRGRRVERYVYNVADSEGRNDEKSKKKMINKGGDEMIPRNGGPIGKDEKEYYV